MKWSIPLFCLIAVLFCCKKQTTQGMETSLPDSSGDTANSQPVSGTKYLALGDSYTIGQSVEEASRFPNQTASFLRQLGDSIAKPEIIATTGWTTRDLARAIIGKNPSQAYRIVTLLIGVNDQFQSRDTSGYRERFRNLLSSAIRFAGNKRKNVYVLSIPDYSVTPFASGYDTVMIRRQIDQFNDINLEVTTQAGAHYLDITPSTREAANDPSLLAQDDLHPSGKEYGKWAVRLADMIHQYSF